MNGRTRFTLSMALLLSATLAPRGGWGGDAPAPKAPAGMAEKLQQPVSVEFQKADLAWVVNTLFVLTGVNILAEDEALHEQSVTLHAENLPLKELLEFIARENSGLKMTVREGSVWIEREVKKASIKDAIPALVTALRDSEDSVRKNAVEALGRIGADAVPALTHALKHSEKKVRAGAAEALGRIAKEP